MNYTALGHDAGWLALQMLKPVTDRLPRSNKEVQFRIDNTTIGLLAMLVGVLLYSRFSRPTPLVHPLLLGKQSEVSNVRKKGETGVYRSFATGQGTPLTVRPANTLKTVQDVVQSSKATTATQRVICDTPLSDEALKELVRLLPLGIKALFPSLSTDASKPSPIATLIPPSPTTALPQLLLALASTPSAPIIPLPSPALLLKALTTDAHPQPGLVIVHKDFVDDVVEQVYEACDGNCGVLILGDPEKEKADITKSAEENGVTVAWWEDVWEAGEQSTASVEEASFSDVHSYFYSIGANGKAVVTKSTHLNITAGISGLLSLFPASKRPSTGLKDVIASSIRLDTPIGMTIALAAIWSGASFRMIGVNKPSWDEPNPFYALQDFLADSALPKPSVIFASSKYHEAFLYRLHLVYRTNPLADWALANTVPGIHDGYVSKKGFYNWLVWGAMRKWVFQGLVGNKLRALIVVGDAPAQETLLLSHLLLSMPITRLHDHPLSAGPIFNSHLYDLQVPAHPVLSGVVPSHQGARSHSGPPAANVEVILKGPGVEDAGGAVAVTGDKPAKSPVNQLKGTVWVRGPAILERVDGEGEIVEGWVNLNEEASVQTNGTFIVTSTAAPAPASVIQK